MKVAESAPVVTAQPGGGPLETGPGSFPRGPISRILKQTMPRPPALDEPFIRAAILSEPDDRARQTVLAHHSARFDEAVGYAEVAARAVLASLEAHIQATRTHRTRLDRTAAQTDVFIAVPGGGKPWTSFELTKVASYLLVSFVLLAVGISAIAQILMASGVPGFEEPARAYLFSFVPIAAAFVLKVLYALFSGDQPRRRFQAFVGGLGLLLSVAWAALFVQTFPGMASSIGSIFEQLEDDGPAGLSGAMVLFVGILSEMCLASALWMEVERIVQTHDLSRQRKNPSFAIVRRSLRRCARSLAYDEFRAGELRAHIRRFEASREAYLTAADLKRDLQQKLLRTLPELQPLQAMALALNGQINHSTTPNLRVNP